MEFVDLFKEKGDPSFMASANCKTTVKEEQRYIVSLYYPEKNAFGNPVAKAKNICSKCSVQKECLQYSIDNKILGEGSGVWGGLSENERRTHVRKNKNLMIEKS